MCPSWQIASYCAPAPLACVCSPIDYSSYIIGGFTTISSSTSLHMDIVLVEQPTDATLLYTLSGNRSCCVRQYSLWQQPATSSTARRCCLVCVSSLLHGCSQLSMDAPSRYILTGNHSSVRRFECVWQHPATSESLRDGDSCPFSCVGARRQVLSFADMLVGASVCCVWRHNTY